jgi:DNA-3-methyladenine glycosylase II
MDAYEQGVRAILGQLVSVAMAAKLASRVVALCGEPVRIVRAISASPRPSAGGSGPAGAESVGMPVKRAESLIHLAQSVVDGTFPLSRPRILKQG